MIKYLIFFFIFSSSIALVGKVFLLPYRKLNIKIDFLSLNMVFGLFVIGSLSFIFNFFSGVSNNLFFIILILILCGSIIILFFYDKNYDFIKNNLKIILFCSFFFFFYSNQLPPGYDAGLYHIPHQVFIQNEKIIFGLSNINSRFGLSSFYNYIAAILWKNDNFTFVSFLQTVYLIIFFIFLYEILKNKKILYNIISISTLLTMPIWFRYNVQGFSLVDFPYAVFFYFSVILSLLIIVDKTEFKNTYIFYFILSCSLAFMHKANGVILFPLLLIITFMCVEKKFLKKKNFFLILFIPSIIVILWILRGTIISGCLIYPLDFTCLDVFWLQKDNATNEYIAAQKWARQGFDLINWPLIFKGILIFSTFLLIFFIYLKNYLIKVIYKNNILLIFCLTFLLIFIYYNASPLEGFSSLLSYKKNLSIINFFRKEIILIIFSNFASILLTLLITTRINNFDLDLNLKKNLFYKISLFYLLFYFLVWFLTAPNPRFAIGAFALIPTLIIILFVKNLQAKSNKMLNTVSKIIIFIIIIKISLLDNLIKKKFDFDLKNIPKPHVVERKTFGSKPVNVVEDNRCWSIRNCYANENDIAVKKYLFNYKVFIKQKE